MINLSSYKDIGLRSAVFSQTVLQGTQHICNLLLNCINLLAVRNLATYCHSLEKQGHDPTLGWVVLKTTVTKFQYNCDIRIESSCTLSPIYN